MRKFNSSKLGKVTFIVVHIIAIVCIFIFVNHWLGYDDFEEWSLSKANSVEIENSLVYFDNLEYYGDRMVNSLLVGIGILVIYWGVRFIFSYVLSKNKIESNNIN